MEINQQDWEALQAKLKRLEEVADRGRLLNYDLKQSSSKKPITVKISEYNEKYIVGWKTLKFELGRNPSTGRTTFAGETAEYEIYLIDKEGTESIEVISGYSAFSDARYDKRIECPVVSKKETANGELLFEIQLPNGKTVSLEDKFIN